MVLIIHTGIVWFLRKTDDGWLNICWKGDKKGRSILCFLQGHMQIQIGKNLASNRLQTLNNKINLNDLNDKMTTFKIKMKSLFLNVR